MSYVEDAVKAFGPIKRGEEIGELGLDKELVVSPSGQRRIRALLSDDGISFYLEMKSSAENWWEVLGISCFRPGEEGGGEKILVAAGFIPLGRDKLEVMDWSTSSKNLRRDMIEYQITSDEQSLEIESLAFQGYPQLGRGEFLPWKVDVKKAVEHWLGIVEECKQDPAKLDQLIFDIPKTVGLFTQSVTTGL